ncbi:MAG: extracellular solute-binding protein [Chloroflexota bacterium]
MQRLADFRKAFPQNPVEFTPLSYGDVKNKLPAVVAAGTAPNGAVWDSILLAPAATRGVFQDISAKAQQAGISAGDYQPWSWNMVYMKNKLYGLPYFTDVRMIYVNSSHLQQAGIPTTAPKTLEEFTSIAQRLATKNADEYTRLGFFPWNDNWSPEGWGFLFGGSYYDAERNRVTLDDPKIVAAFDWAGGVARQLGYQAVQTFVGAHKGDLFTTQLLSCFIQSTSYLKPVTAAGAGLSWTPWAPPPPQGIDHTSTFSGGFSAVMPAGAKNPDASFELLRYLSDAAFQRIEIKTGRFPPLKVVAADPYWDTVDPRIKQFVAMLPSSHALPVIPQIDIFETEINKAYTAVLSGQQSASQALGQANQIINAAIQENRLA